MIDVVLSLLSYMSKMRILLIIAVQCVAFILSIRISGENDSLSVYKWWSLTALWTITSCTLVFVFALNLGYVSKLSTNKAILFVGSYSANAFLIHQLFFRYMNSIECRLFGKTYSGINIFTCFTLTMICAFIWDKIVVAIRKKKSGKQSSPALLKPDV